MIRAIVAVSAMSILGLGAVLAARTGNGDPVDRVQGMRISSRLPCDGATNPQEELKLATSFSPGGWQRSFHLDVFESQFCKRVDLYFFCLTRGHDRWKPEWVGASQGPAAPARYWMDACATWGAKDAPEYVLSGWYQEGAAAKKLSWKQAAIKKTADNPETYEFSDPNGGTAQIKINRM
ncbi:MAG: hypothetical protein ABSH50_05545 [Bryobacteraceae bacterium]